MSSLRFYISDYNGILTDLQEKLKDKLASPRDADIWVVWQDAQGSYKDLIQTAQKLGVAKPTYVVQHGVASTRDYDKPHSFPLSADRFLCWGKADYERLCSLGYKDKAHIVGCPLNVKILPKVAHKEKVVLFVPVNTGKEEPENLMVYYELLRIKYDKAKSLLSDRRLSLKDKWSIKDKLNVDFNELAINLDVVSKLLPWHDRNLYHGSSVVGHQDSPNNNKLLFSLLRNVDLVVGLDEGTTEAFAFGHNVPVITVDGFQYRQYKPNGKDFEIQAIKHSKASQHCELKDLAYWVDYMLDHPEHLEKERKEVAEEELGLSYGNATENILKFVREDVKAFCNSR